MIGEENSACALVFPLATKREKVVILTRDLGKTVQPFKTRVQLWEGH